MESVPATNVRAPKEVDPDISESNILPSKKRYNICNIPDPDGTCSGGTNNKTVPPLNDQTIEKRAINCPLPLDDSPQESELHDHNTPIKTSDTCSEHNIQESLIADLPLPYIPPEYPGYFPNLYKEIPLINFRQTNFSLGDMDKLDISATTKSTKRSLEDNGAEIEVLRDKWNNENVRGLEIKCQRGKYMKLSMENSLIEK